MLQHVQKVPVKEGGFIISATSFDDDIVEDAVESRAVTVPNSAHGQRLDRVLAELIPEFSRSYLQQLIAAQAVRGPSGVWAKPASKVSAGHMFNVELRPTAQSQAFVPQAMQLNVVYEDEHLLVVDKPAGLVVHPAPGNWSGTLLNGLLARDPAAAQVPRAGIVHRLDKDTSGLMVVARTRATMDALVQAIAARTVRREYVALAHGRWRGATAQQVRQAIGRDPRNRLRMAVVNLEKTAGKSASTIISLLQNTEQGCWVRCVLETGRTHQIRVHMAWLGHPLVADALYCGQGAAGMQRQALHAFRLGFDHPVSGKSLSFESMPPADMLDALQAWGLQYNAPSAIEPMDDMADMS